jgi:hypothetical protein
MTTTFPNAPLPDQKEVKARTSVVRQAWRFAILNVRMITMVTKRHH